MQVHRKEGSEGEARLSSHPSIYLLIRLFLHSHKQNQSLKMLARPDADNKPEKDENVFKQAWHSVEQALHLKSDPPVEDVPPPGRV